MAIRIRYEVTRAPIVLRRIRALAKSKGQTDQSLRGLKLSLQNLNTKIKSLARRVKPGGKRWLPGGK